MRFELQEEKKDFLRFGFQIVCEAITNEKIKTYVDFKFKA